MILPTQEVDPQRIRAWLYLLFVLGVQACGVESEYGNAFVSIVSLEECEIDANGHFCDVSAERRVEGLLYTRDDEHLILTSYQSGEAFVTLFERVEDTIWVHSNSVREGEGDSSLACVRTETREVVVEEIVLESSTTNGCLTFEGRERIVEEWSDGCGLNPRERIMRWEPVVECDDQLNGWLFAEDS